MIPKIIHQTWNDNSVPDNLVAMQKTWIEMHPGWQHILWTDQDLDRLVSEHYPDFYQQYRDYPVDIERSDAGRYLVLHHCGGVYADLDTTCEMPFDFLTDDDRVILAEEPREQTATVAGLRKLDFLVTNAVMASPKNHPFWKKVLATMKACVHAQKKDVLEATGPLMLTGCVLNYTEKNDIALHSCHLFSSLTSDHTISSDPEHGDYSPRRASTHYWAGSWYGERKNSILRKLRCKYRQALYQLKKNYSPDGDFNLDAVDRQILEKNPIVDPGNWDQTVAILIPLRDAENYLDRCFELIGSLDYPKDLIKLVFCEGDSSDNTTQLLGTYIEKNISKYRDIISLKLDVGTKWNPKKRWLQKYQRKRRSGLAKVRNHLVNNGLRDNDDWALWIDVDVSDYPPDILKTLLGYEKHIITPNCVLETGGSSFDLNNFLDVGIRSDQRYYKYVTGGIFHPLATYEFIRHLHDLKYLEIAPLTGVGGTMLLVHSSVYKAGIRFPEIPYRDLLETEGFGQLACDVGITPFGLPNHEIFHLKN